MGKGFIKFVKSERSERLRKDPNAFMILMECAIRANRFIKTNALGMAQFQCVIGKSDFPWMTEKDYRGAKRRLTRGGLVTLKGRTNGTIATLSNAMIWDINAERGEAKGGPMAQEGRTSGTLGAPNKNKEKEERKRKEIKEVFDYLNLKTGKNFSHATKATSDYVSARLKEHPVEALKLVIDRKVKQWKGNPQMEPYLKPDTLFRPSNFEAYVNEKDNVVNMNSNDPRDLDAFLRENDRKLALAKNG